MASRLQPENMLEHQILAEIFAMVPSRVQDAINELLTAASRRAGLDRPVRPHQLRHAFGSNLADANAGLDEIAELLGHA